MIKLNAPTELRSTLETMKSAKAKGVNMNIWENDIKAVENAVETIEALRALPAQRWPEDDDRSLPTYGQIPWRQLGRDVIESQTARREDFDFGDGYPGHKIVPSINFNSLARIVDKYRYYGQPAVLAEGKPRGACPDCGKHDACDDHCSNSPADIEINLMDVISGAQKDWDHPTNIAGAIMEKFDVRRRSPAEIATDVSALDNSQSLLVMIYHLGTEFSGVERKLWDDEDLTKQIGDQIKENRAVLDRSSQPEICDGEVVAAALYEARNHGLKHCWSWDDSGLDDEHPGARDYYRSMARDLLSKFNVTRKSAVTSTNCETAK